MADQNISQLTAQTGASVDRSLDLMVIWDDSASGAARTKKITLPELEAALTGLQPIDADISAIAALSTTGFIERTGAGTASTFAATTFGKSLIDDTDAATARGTLGLVIGTDVQAYNLRLADIANNLSATSGAIEKTGANTFGTYTVSTFGKSLIDDADAATARTTLGVVPGSDVQPYSDRLTALANISATSGTFEKTGLNTVGVYTVSTFGKSLIDDADQAAAQGTLGLVPGTNVQAYSARLADIVSGFAGATNGQFLRKNAGGTALEYATVSGTGTVSSVALTAPTDVFTVSGSPITSAGTLAIAFKTDVPANQFLASPNGSAGAMGPRAIAAADLPDLSGTYQTLDVDLTAVANLSTTGLIKRTGSGSATTVTSTTFTESLLDDADAATARSTLGVVIGTDVQAYSARLNDITSNFAAASTLQVIRKNAAGTALEFATVSAGSATWGGISGTITDQTDLITYINNRMGIPYLFASNLTLDTAAYADGDVFADLLTITNAVTGSGNYSLLESITVNDKDDQGFGIDFYLFNQTVTLASKNAAWNTSDSDLDNCLAIVQVTAGDFIDSGPNRQATLTGLSIPCTPASGTSLYLGTRIRGAGTYTASGVRVTLGFRRFG